MMNNLKNNNPEFVKKNKKAKKTVKKDQTTSVAPSATPPVPCSEPPTQEKEEKNQEELNTFPYEFLKHLEDSIKEAVNLEIANEKPIEDYTPLELMATQYLKSFLIIGYGLNGEKVFIGHAKTAEEHDSLVEHLRRTFSNVMNNVN